MPRYYFDTDDGYLPIRDDEGLELADNQAARDEASRAMGDLAKDYLPGAGPQKNITMWVRNERGEAVLQLALSFAVIQLAPASP